MIVLDTNVISEFGRREPDTDVSQWLRRQAFSELVTCAPVVSELWFGACRVRLRTGSDRYLAAFHRVMNNVLANRILPFDDESARICGGLRAEREGAGRPISVFDAMIASICIANGATLSTRNTGDFAGLDLKVINPFEAG